MPTLAIAMRGWVPGDDESSGYWPGTEMIRKASGSTIGRSPPNLLFRLEMERGMANFGPSLPLEYPTPLRVAA